MYGWHQYKTTEVGVTMYPKGSPEIAVTLMYPIPSGSTAEGFTLHLGDYEGVRDSRDVSTMRGEVAVTALVQGF